MGRMVGIEFVLDEDKSFWQMSADDFREDGARFVVRG